MLKKMQQTGCSSIFAKYQGQLEYVERELISSGRKRYFFFVQIHEIIAIYILICCWFLDIHSGVVLILLPYKC